MPLSKLEDLQDARHVIGLDLGTTNLRLRVDHRIGKGTAPASVHLPGSNGDGSLPCVLEFGDDGALRSYGRPALGRMSGHDSPNIVSEFKPCLGQSPEDLGAQGRPERARYCGNPRCLHPGWAWSVAMRFCGFCGHELPPASHRMENWRPTFRYSQEKALGYAESLLNVVHQRLKHQFGESISGDAGWAISAGVPVHWQEKTLEDYSGVLSRAFPEAPVRLVQEPIGALRHFAQQQSLSELSDKDGWTLVVDFGGGTTDLVLAKVDHSYGYLRVTDVRSYGERYGGADFDLVLAHYAAGELDVNLDGGILAQWRMQAREWKEMFSAKVQQAGLECEPVENRFPVPRGAGLFAYESVSLGSETFTRIAADLLERFRSVLDRGIRHFRIAPQEVKQVVLTGGGARWYFVELTVRAKFPDARLLSGEEPEMAISSGLSLVGREAAPPQPEERPTPVPPTPPEPPIRGEDAFAETILSHVEASAGWKGEVDGPAGRVSVEVPPKTVDGASVTVRGGGRPGRNGGADGDLLVRVRVRPPLPVPGKDRAVQLSLSYEQVASGGSWPVEGGQGTVQAKVPPGVSDGWLLQIPGAGAPGTHGGPPGVLDVTVRVARPIPVRGEDAVAILAISYEEALVGTVKGLDGPRGYMRVTVPPNSVELPEIRVPGEGGLGLHGGPAGDLLVRLKVAPPLPVVGLDMEARLALTHDQAVAGGKWPVEGAHGPKMVKVEPGSQNGQVIRLQGQGWEGKHGGKAGDLCVKLAVAPPTPIPGADRKASLNLSHEAAQRGGKHAVRTPEGDVSVVLPSGVTDGQAMVFPGQGEPGRHGGKAGDLKVTVCVEAAVPRAGKDAEAALKLSSAEAMQGGEFTVTGPSGKVSVRVPASTAKGHTIVVPGEGHPGIYGGAAGDLRVTVGLKRWFGCLPSFFIALFAVPYIISLFMDRPDPAPAPPVAPANSGGASIGKRTPPTGGQPSSKGGQPSVKEMKPQFKKVVKWVTQYTTKTKADGKRCPRCKKKYSANFKFCPLHPSPVSLITNYTTVRVPLPNKKRVETLVRLSPGK